MTLYSSTGIPTRLAIHPVHKNSLFIMLKGMFMEYRIDHRNPAAWLPVPPWMLAQIESEESPGLDAVSPIPFP